MAIRPAASAAARALIRALPPKVVSGSSGSARPSVGGRDHLKPLSEQRRQFARLAGVVGGGDQPRAGIETQCHAGVLTRPSSAANTLAFDY